MLAGLNRRLKLVLGLATIWPLLYLVIFFGFFALTFIPIILSGPEQTPDQTTFFTAFGVIFVLHLATIILSLLLMALYIVDVLKSDRIAENRKALWAIVLFFGGLLALPIYWYMFV